MLSLVASPLAAGEKTYQLGVSGFLHQYSVGGGAAIPFAMPTLAISATALLILATLAALKIGIPLYTKLRKDRLLDAASRDSLFRMIQQTPGIHFLELHKQFALARGNPDEVGFGALSYHLGQMERFQLIVSKREGRYRRFFDAAVNASNGADTARIAFLQNEPIPLIVADVMAHRGTTQVEIHARVSRTYAVTRQAVAYHVKRLVDKDLLAFEEHGRFCHYRVTDRLMRLMPYVTVPPAASPVVSESDVSPAAA